MYNYGLVQFLQIKKLKSKECIDKFLLSEGITNFNSKNHDRVNDYIQKNWVKFASFCDKGIKSKELNGKAVRLNYSFDEQKNYQNKAREEYESLNLTLLQKAILNKIKNEYGAGFLQAFLNKKGLKSEGKNLSYHSKNLQWLDVVNNAIENGFNFENLKTNEINR